MSDTTTSSVAARLYHLPNEPHPENGTSLGFWLYLMSDCLIFAALFALLLLTGCAGLGGGYDPQAWSAHQTRNQNLQKWRVFAVAHVKSANASNMFDISWLQKNDVFDIYLIAPGRQKADAHIVGKSDDADVVTFEHTHVDGIEEVVVKEHYQGDDVEQLVLEKLHLLLPVSGLAHWLRGLESPNARGASLTSIGNKNRLDFLMQDGWDVTYQSYAEHEGYLLPERLKLTSHRLKGFVIDLDVKLWQFRDFYGK